MLIELSALAEFVTDFDVLPRVVIEGLGSAAVARIADRIEGGQRNRVEVGQPDLLAKESNVDIGDTSELPKLHKSVFPRGIETTLVVMPTALREIFFQNGS